MIAMVTRLLHVLLLCKFFSYISVAELKSISKSIKIVKILIWGFGVLGESHVSRSFELPEMTIQTNQIGLLNIISSVINFTEPIKIYQASSSELFGNSSAPQGFKSIFDPQSPYAIAKLGAHHLTKLYNNQGNLAMLSGLLFNHESFRRGEDFVTKKIVLNAARIRKETERAVPNQEIEKLRLGNLDAKRDWGWAPEYMLGVLNSTLASTSTELLIGTGKSASVKEFASRAFANFDLDFEEWVEYDSAFERPSELHFLEASVEDVQESLGWVPKFDWKLVCDLMSEEQLAMQEKNIDWKHLASESDLAHEF